MMRQGSSMVPKRGSRIRRGASAEYREWGKRSTNVGLEVQYPASDRILIAMEIAVTAMAICRKKSSSSLCNQTGPTP